MKINKTLSNSYFSKQYITTILCLTILVLFDQIYVYLSYSGQFLYTIKSKFLFVIQGISLIFIISLPLVLIKQIRDKFIIYYSTSYILNNKFWGLNLQVLILSIINILLVNNGNGHRFYIAPLWQSFIILLPGLLFYITGKILLRNDKNSFRYNTSSILSIFTVIINMSYFLPGWYNGQFGFFEKSLIMTSVTIFSNFIIVFFFLLYYKRDIFFKKPSYIIYGQIISFVLLILIYCINGNIYVDNYYNFHLLIMIFSIFICWHLSDSFLFNQTFINSINLSKKRVSFIFSIGLLLITISASPKSVSGYVGTLHTVHQKFFLEFVYKNINILPFPPQKIKWFLSQKIFNFDSTNSEVPSLSSTFHAIRHTQTTQLNHIKNIVIFMLDMKKPEDIGLYTKNPLKTPNINKHLEDAFIFKNCFSAANTTAEVFPTIYTGTYRSSTRYSFIMQNKPPWYFYQKNNSIGHVFKKFGYNTIVLTNQWYYNAFFSKKELEPIYGGFKHIIFENSKIPNTTQALIDIYNKNRGIIPNNKPYLTFVHIFEHAPHKINEVDKLVSSIIKEIKVKNHWNDTIILLTADHGVQYREHGRTTYGQTLFKEEVQVPLIIRIPGLKGRFIEDYVSSVDHLPTIIDLFKFSVDFMIEGISYLPVFFGEKLKSNRPIFIESGNATAIIQGDYKLIKRYNWGPYELFNIEQDSGEIYNLVEDPRYKNQFKQLYFKLEKFINAHKNG